MDEYSGQYNWIKPSWFEEGFEKGFEKGLQQSRKRIAEFVIRQIKKRFGNLEKTPENQILALPIEKIEKLAMALLDFKDADELRLWLNRVSQNN